MNSVTKAYLAIIINAVIIGLSFFFVKTGLESVNSIGLLAHRFTGTAICITLYIVFTGKKINLTFSDWKRIIPYSLAFPIMFFLMQTIGLTMVLSSEAGIIYAIGPILTFIIAKIFLKESNTTIQTLFMILSVFGIVFINVMKGNSLGYGSVLGCLFIIISAFSVAFYNVFIKKISKDYSFIQISYVVIISGFIIFNIAYLVQSIVSESISNYFNAFMNIRFIISILFLSIFSSFVTILLATYALSKLKATTVSLSQNLSTVISILAGVILLNEKLYYYSYIGIVCVLVGTLGFNLTKKEK